MFQEEGGEDFEAAAHFLVHNGGHEAREVGELPARIVLWWENWSSAGGSHGEPYGCEASQGFL